LTGENTSILIAFLLYICKSSIFLPSTYKRCSFYLPARCSVSLRRR